jgi:outer membrane protein assembly factor BamB
LAVAAGAVFTMTLDGTLCAVDPATGAAHWRAIDLAPSGAPVVAGGTVYLADATGGMLALDAGTGARHWRSKLRSGIGARSSAALADGLLVVGVSDSTLEAFDAATGTRRWTDAPSHTIPGGLLGPPRSPEASSTAWSPSS